MSRLTTHRWLPLCSALCLFHYIYCGCVLPELDIPNGEVIILPSLEEDETLAEELSIMQFKCFEDYVMVGKEYIQCVLEKWTDDVPFCAGLRCPVPPKVENAEYVTKPLTTDLKTGSVVEYKCVDGYELVNEDDTFLECFMKNDSDTAVWQGELPQCTEKTSCPDPGRSKNGGRNGTCCMSGSFLEFNCSSDHELVGDHIIRCLRSGRWSSNRPLCRPLEGFCELPPAIPHGYATGNETGDFFVQGEVASIMCHHGYKFTGSSYPKCLEGGWDKEFGACEEIFCNAPEPIEHGTIRGLKANNYEPFKFNSEITYVCDKGYRLQSGDSRSICRGRGWSGKKPRCEVVKCPDPGILEYGRKLGSNYSVGAKISFSCFSGFELLGSVERHCLPNGQWNGELTRCNAEGNYCPDPGIPIRGSKTGNMYQMGDIVRFQCLSEHRMSGSEVRECLPDRTWSGEETKCFSYDDFDDDKEVSFLLKSIVAEKAAFQKKELDNHQITKSIYINGVLHTLDLNHTGRIILYFAFDVSGSIGQINFNRSIDFAKAIVKKVGISHWGARAGALTFSSKANILFYPMDLNSTEGVLEALDKVTFIGGGTSASSALKAIREQHLPLVEKWLPGDNVKHALFILTDGKANMGGNPVMEANLLKKAGVEIFCIGITGDIRQKSLYDIASSSKYGVDEKERPNVFILKSYETLAWLVHEITNGTIDYSECGLGMEHVGLQIPKVFGGNKSTKPWPWMAAFIMRVGREHPPQKILHCGGSIIHPRFILTAAHCLFNRITGQELDKSKFIVYLGMLDLKKENVTEKNEFEVRRMIYHERYSNENLDNDIALLELSRPIEYSASVRPVCLPPNEIGDLYKPSSNVWATGWGVTTPIEKTRNRYPATSDLVTSDILKEIRLPIQGREACQRSLEGDNPKAVFTNSMFCAGDGLGTEDTCLGDSGGPVMRRSVNKDGYPIWIQVGIVSWGLGCGQKLEYGFYTHVHELMPWIESKIKDP